MSEQSPCRVRVESAQSLYGLCSDVLEYEESVRTPHGLHIVCTESTRTYGGV
jgi:hypothetical protein